MRFWRRNRGTGINILFFRIMKPKTTLRHYIFTTYNTVENKTVSDIDLSLQMSKQWQNNGKKPQNNSDCDGYGNDNGFNTVRQCVSLKFDMCWRHRLSRYMIVCLDMIFKRQCFTSCHTPPLSCAHRRKHANARPRHFLIREEKRQMESNEFFFAMKVQLK